MRRSLGGSTLNPYPAEKGGETLENQKEPLSQVKKLQDLINRHAVDETVDMFADDAELELVGLNHLVGKEEIRNGFEYDEAVNSELEFFECISEGNIVNCRMKERNDRLMALGLSEARYTPCVLEFKDGLIQKFSATIHPGILRAMEDKWRAFLPWFSEHYPVEHSQMTTPEGLFIGNGENGRKVVPILNEWRSSLEESDE